MFGSSADPEYEGHYLLEINIAPLSSAIRSNLSGISPIVVPAACRAATVLLTVAPLADETTARKIIALLTDGLDIFTRMC